MNFPGTPLYEFFYWLINTPPIGGIMVGIIATVSLTSYGLTLRWIANGAKADEKEVYAYPTPTLHGHN